MLLSHSIKTTSCYVSFVESVSDRRAEFFHQNVDGYNSVPIVQQVFTNVWNSFKPSSLPANSKLAQQDKKERLCIILVYIVFYGIKLPNIL